MMLREASISLLLYFMALISVVNCALNNDWNTLYSFSDGKVYLHLKNNDLVSLNFSVSGFNDMEDSKYTEKQLNLQNGQQVEKLATPPVNTSLVLVQEELYGFNAVSEEGGSVDGCGNGVLNLIRYDRDSDKWETVSGLGYDDIADASFYQHSTYLSAPNDDIIYIYGGVCESSEKVSNRMISFDINKAKFSNITTSTKPQAFYGATNLLAPNPQTQLVIGGQSNNGWLNMYQLATWDFSSGWSFKQVSDAEKSTEVNSRRFPLALPIFDPLTNNSNEAFTNFYNVKEVLLIGGELLDTDSSPVFAKLSTSTNSWTWDSADNSGLGYDEILGGVTIFDTLVIINSTRSVNKRDTSDQYTINLYDVHSFEAIENIKDNTESKDSGNDSSDVTKKAVLGTVLPVFAIAVAITTAFFIKRKRKQNANDDNNDMDYQFGTYYDQESALNQRARRKSNPFDNDTSSTLDAASIDSWVKKRQQFDEKRTKTIRNSYLASNETLSSNSSHLTKSTDDDHEKLENKIITKPEPSPLQTNLVNRSVSKLKKSFSMSSTPTTPVLSHEYGSIKKKKSTSTLNHKPVSTSPLSDDEADVVKAANITDLDTSRENINDEDSESDASVDDKMDVQVLVSSKRRSVLRIVNPDLETINDENEENEYLENDFEDNTASINDREDTSIRQRVPSGDRTLEDD